MAMMSVRRESYKVAQEMRVQVALSLTLQASKEAWKDPTLSKHIRTSFQDLNIHLKFLSSQNIEEAVGN